MESLFMKNFFRNGALFKFLIIFAVLFTFNVQALAESPLSISAKFAISYDIDSEEVIFSIRGDQKSYPASITKLMTALLLSENMERTDLLEYSKVASIQEAVSYRINVHYIAVGDKIRADYAMDALLLFSANDIAYAIAENVGGTANKFIQMMNTKAEELGMKGTSFETPNGLDRGYPNHYTTAEDLALLIKAAYNDPWVRETMNKKSSRVKTENTPFMTLKNRNKNLGNSGCVGGKTGYTNKAGRCLSAVYERDGRTIVTIVLNSRDIFGDTKKLADFSFSRKSKIITPKEKTIMRIPITYHPQNSIVLSPVKFRIHAVLEEDVTNYDPDYKPDVIIDLYNDKPFTILDKSTILGKVTLKTSLGERTINILPHKDFKKIAIENKNVPNSVFPEVKIEIKSTDETE